MSSRTDSGPRGSSPDGVVDAILQRIAAGRLVPGQRLVEADLTRQLQVSRGPVREAFKRLAAEGIITLSRHRGACVRAFSRQAVDDVLRVTEALSALASRLAARRIDEGDHRAQLEEAFRVLMACSGQTDSQAYQEARGRFYDTLIRISGNREIHRVMPRTQVVLLRLQFQAYLSGAQREAHFADYRAMTEAVLAGDAERAEHATADHIRRRRENLTRLPREAYASDDE
ncbi:GntR family transcriptional regulator [Algiphilus sp.]|uniref:GntR family transcriptional regulator n=1 Tax=Algiphilus sp. TaxID=1872431 RepID=UPI0025C1C3A4|nr:GntR family transcriptional regulator [Algiphilus sp.]MCK5771190.1 GntR family transcriptional regulator [Algiphilus sp.]